MADFELRVRDARQGTRLLRGEASSAAALAQQLGLHPADLLTVRELRPARPRQRARALPARLLAQELAVLLDAGVPLLEALETLRDKDSGDAAHPLQAVLARLRQGQALSVALAGPPAVVDPLFIALVAASERSGQLATTLRHHAAYLAWSESLRSRLSAALIYPAMLLGAGLAVVFFLLVFVLPRFAGVFDGMARELPAASRWLIELGVLTAAHPGVAGLLALSLPLAALLLWRLDAARQSLQRLAWRLPGLGRRLRTVALSRLYRCVGLLAAAGVPIPTALQLAEGVLAAPLRPALRAAQRQVASGQRLSAALQAEQLATPVALRMLRVGEGSGELAAMLERAAAFHDEEIAQLSELVTRVVNPLLMLVMGVVIGGIVVLMYLPIFTLMEQVQ